MIFIQITVLLLYIISNISRIEQKTQIHTIQASQCDFNTKQSFQEQKDAHLENNKKFQEQSYSNYNDLSSKCHLLKNNTELPKLSQMSINQQLIDDNLSCTSQTSSVSIQVEKQKISIQAKKRIKKQKCTKLEVVNQSGSRKQTNVNHKVQKREQKSIPNDLPFQNEKEEIISVPFLETIIHQDVKEKTFIFSDQYYMHNLFGYLMGYLKDSFMAQMYSWIQKFYFI